MLSNVKNLLCYSNSFAQDSQSHHRFFIYLFIYLFILI